ncbi:hypothetical protein MXF20_15400 [Pantoea dispersa]|uniref:hypothetical protein n=1 Tax=Pantoea dispersa TaxID=59814 RepID=UPI002DB8ED5E|nr:hypothetical protein [Pantoea dispersa]MEB5973465.1 hypothetical protein [Pantoea dispersa]
MSQPSNELIKCDSASVRLSNGEVFEFPIVDNKDLFPNLFRAESDFNIQVQCYLIDSEIYAMYKRKENIAYLVCAWENNSEINEEAMLEITTNPELAYLLN